MATPPQDFAASGANLSVECLMREDNDISPTIQDRELVWIPTTYLNVILRRRSVERHGVRFFVLTNTGGLFYSKGVDPEFHTLKCLMAITHLMKVTLHKSVARGETRLVIKIHSREGGGSKVSPLELEGTSLDETRAWCGAILEVLELQWAIAGDQSRIHPRPLQGLTMGAEGWYLEATGRMALYELNDAGVWTVRDRREYEKIHVLQETENDLGRGGAQGTTKEDPCTSREGKYENAEGRDLAGKPPWSEAAGRLKEKHFGSCEIPGCTGSLICNTPTSAICEFHLKGCRFSVFLPEIPARCRLCGEFVKTSQPCLRVPDPDRGLDKDGNAVLTYLHFSWRDCLGKTISRSPEPNRSVFIERVRDDDPHQRLEKRCSFCKEPIVADDYVVRTWLSPPLHGDDCAMRQGDRLRTAFIAAMQSATALDSTVSVDGIGSS